tara:strand:+ start:1166 stop:1741 length:576 start_codon:yes stop_codon:yes gene_type:complete
MFTDFIHRYPIYTRDECEQIMDDINYFESNNMLLDYLSGDRPNHLHDHMEMSIPHHYHVEQSMTSPLGERFFPRLQDPVHDYVSCYSILQEKRFLIYNLKLKKIKAGGGFHEWHYENASIETSMRQFVIQVYLNDDFEGGETEFLYLNKREKAVQGEMIIFPAAFTHTHRGNPPLGNSKYLITTWAYLQEV